MNVELKFSFVQDNSKDSRPEIARDHEKMKDDYLRMITTLVCGMVCSSGNCDIDSVKISLDGNEIENILPPE